MQAVGIRTAEPRDVIALADIGFRAWEASILPILTATPDLRDIEAARLVRAVAELLERIIVAESGGQVVGWCSRLARKPYIPYLFVAPEKQGQGIGSLLLARMESLIELAGCDLVRLETPADHVRGVQFYEKQGYHIVPRPRDSADHRAFMSIWLEKPLFPFIGAIAKDE